MTKFLFYVIFLSITFQACAQEKNKRVPRAPDKKEKEYGGKVKKIETYYCTEYRGEGNSIVIDKNSCELLSIEEYDKNETRLKKVGTGLGNGNTYLETVRTDEKGRVIERVSKFLRGTEQRYDYTYNKDGFVTESNHFIDKKLMFRSEIIYDEYNYPIKEMNYGEGGVLAYYYTYEYDNQSREILRMEYDNENNFVEKKITKYKKNSDAYTESKYDGNGRLLEEDKFPIEKTITYHPNGKIKSEYHFIYDKQVKIDVYSTYDEAGRKTEWKRYEGGKWTHTHTWKYREDGILIEKSESRNDTPYYKSTTHYRAFDRYNNWTAQYYTNVDGEVTALYVRKITYYE